MFQVRDLLIVAAVVLGVACGIYRHEIVAAARQNAAPVFWYVDAPAREAEMARSHAAEIAKLEAHIDRLGKDIWAVHSDKLDAQMEVHQLNLQLADKTSEVEAQRGLVAAGECELAAFKARYANLCQRLLELGNDVPSVLAGE